MLPMGLCCSGSGVLRDSFVRSALVPLSVQISRSPFYNIRETAWPTKKAEIGHKGSKFFVRVDVSVTGAVLSDLPFLSALQLSGITMRYSEQGSV
jgi:hypothetical protein